MPVRSRLPGADPASTEHVVPLPPDRRNGDRVVVGFVNNVATATTSPSAGWDTDPSWTVGQGMSTNLRLTIFTRVMDGSEDDVLTVTMIAGDPEDGNNVAAVWVADCMEGDGGLPVAQVHLADGGNATTGEVAPIIGLASGDYDSLIFLGLDNNEGTGHTISRIPAGYGNLPGAITSPGDNTDAVCVYEIDQSATGVTGFAPTPDFMWTGGEDQWITAQVVTAAVLAPPAQTISPPTIPAPIVTQRPTVIRGFRIRPDTIPAPALPSPTIHPGPVSVVPTGAIPPPAAPPAPKVKYVIRPPFMPSGSVVYAPTVTAGIRPPLRIDFWAVDDDGSLLCPLPQPLAWDLSIVPGEKGAITLEYPRDGLNFDVLDQRVTRARDLRIRIRTDGVASTALSGILSARDGDEVAESASVQFFGAFLPALLDEAPLPYNTADERGETTFVDGTAGSILRDVLATVQADGYLAGLTFTFTDTHDSNGNPWTTQTSAKFPPGRTVLQIAQQLRAWGMLEFEVVDTAAGALELRGFDPSAVGTDFTLSDPPIVFRAGRDLLESPHRVDVSKAVTSLLVAGDDGVYVEVDDPTAIAERGRKIGRYVSEGNLTTEGAAQAYGLIELARTTHGVDEITHALTFDQNQPAPIRELLPLDYVYSDRGAGLQRLRIAQVTVSQRAGTDHYSGAVVLGDLIAARDVVLQRALDGLTGGQIITGTSEPAPDTDDGKPPAQAQGLQVASGAYSDQDNTLAAVTATWLPVDENADGSPATDIDHYDVRYRYTGGDAGLPPGFVPVPSVTDTTATWDGVVAGVAIGVQVRAVDRFGHLGEWSVEELHTTDSDTTPPPVPSTPLASNYIGLLRVDWDGLGSAGEVMPSDFSVAEVMVSQTTDFDPDTDPFQVIAQLRGAQSYAWSPGTTDVEWFVKLRSVDKSGNQSAPSAQASAVPGLVEEGDIGSVSIGVLTTGTLDALLIVGDRIATGTTGSRVEIDGGSGLFCINSEEEVVFSYDIDDELLEMRGRLVAGEGVGVGPTVVVDPSSPPALRMYPTATEDRFELISRTTGRPNGQTAAGFELRGLNASGQTNGLSLEAWSTNVWLAQKDTAGNQIGGAVKLQQTGEAFLTNEDNSTVVVANVNDVIATSDSGDVELIAGNDVNLFSDNQIFIECGGSEGSLIVMTPGSIELWIGDQVWSPPVA